MPNPCDYDDQNSFVSACVSARQDENPDESRDQSVAACINIWEDRDCGGSKGMNDKVIFKTGTQDENDPYVFVMSTDSPDRMGDVVEQDWKLGDFRKNPIALFNHASSQPIGVWEQVKKEGSRLVGRLKLAKEGTSDLIDTLRSLVEQRILRAVSVGFRPSKAEPLDEKDPWGGYRLSGNSLLECSLVSIPANAEALSLAKSLGAKVPPRLLAETGAAEPGFTAAAEQLGVQKSRRSDNPKPENPSATHKRNTDMSLQDKIKSTQEAITNDRNMLTELIEKDVSELDSDELQAHDDQVDELTQRIAKSEGDLARHLKVEAALATKGIEQELETRQPAPQGAPSDHQVPRITARKNREPHFNAIASVACLVKAHTMRMSPLEVLKQAPTLKDDANELQIVIRAATDPASMTDAAWAGPLVQETWSAFLDLIRDIAVYPRLPGLRLEFDRYGKINIPKNTGRGGLAGGFVGELSPIPVKEGIYGSTDLSPKKLAVISSFSKEIGEHSMPAIQGLVQNQMVEDTAETLDTLYLDATARSTTRPAGLQDPTETGAGNINASTGATVAQILADTKAMIGRMLAARTGNGAVWIMNPLRVLGLRDAQDSASGEFVFRAELAAGTFRGYPVIESQNVTEDVVVLQSNGAVTYANDYAPRIEVSDETALVFDDTAPDNLLPDTNTQPAKSMFQVDAVAVKFKQSLDWRVVRIGGVQVLTGVAW